MHPHLVYSSDAEPGIRRQRRGKGFSYRLPDGARVSDEATLARIRGLGIPPAYRDVWICVDADGHVQATGLDDKGRKQYRYHPDWTAHRDGLKYSLLPAFGLALPRMRRRFERGLDAEPGSFDFTASTLALLLDHAPMRIGHSAYTEANGSYGATTLTRRHVRFGAHGVRFRFRGKSGQMANWTVNRRRLNVALEGVADLPGRTLFSWIGESGEPRSVASGDFNRFLSEAAGFDGVTSKVFRTWAGTLAAYNAAHATLADGARPSVKSLAHAASQRLANTPSVARKSYIHPAVLALADAAPPEPIATRAISGLRADEARLVSFLDAVNVGVEAVGGSRAA